MGSYDEIVESLGGYTTRQRALFVCACAERAHAVVAVLAEASTAWASRVALDRAWRSIESPASLQGALEELGKLPEAKIHDSNEPRYYAMRALGLIADALRAADRRPEDFARSAAGGALDLASDLVAVAASEGGLLEQEAAAQRSTLALLHDVALSREAAGQIRRAGSETAAAFARAAEEVVRRARGRERDLRSDRTATADSDRVALRGPGMENANMGVMICPVHRGQPVVYGCRHVMAACRARSPIGVFQIPGRDVVPWLLCGECRSEFAAKLADRVEQENRKYYGYDSPGSLPGMTGDCVECVDAWLVSVGEAPIPDVPGPVVGTVGDRSEETAQGYDRIDDRDERTGG